MGIQTGGKGNYILRLIPQIPKQLDRRRGGASDLLLSQIQGLTLLHCLCRLINVSQTTENLHYGQTSAHASCFRTPFVEAGRHEKASQYYRQS
jgi:hypothetical protein